jgi:poly-gamma-glutamate synthesis protein (capsule biosynthesis protein)
MWATHNRPGCAYVHIITHYEIDYATPGGPPTIYTWAVPKSLKAMQENIQELKQTCDVVVVSLHKGLGHTPIKLADYEQQVSYAAIDAGADLVVSHHAHILHGIETYKGKVIFHGLGNFGTYLPFLAPKEGDTKDSWASRRREIFGFEPDPEYPTYPFHPEAIYTMIAKCIIEDGGITQVSYIPAIVNKQAQPEIVTRNNRGQEVFDYVKSITEGANLNAQFQWDGEEVIIKF